MSKIKSKVNEEFYNSDKHNTKYNDEINKLKVFLQAPPFFPNSMNNFAPYLSLVQSIDLGTVRIIEREVLRGLPSVKEIYDLYTKVKLCFDGQEVDGKYFDREGKIILPKKGEIEEYWAFLSHKSGETSNNVKLVYKIIDSKSDDERILRLIENFKYETCDVFWIISPWGFPKNVRNAAKEKTHVYLSSYSSLEDLYTALNKDPLI